MADNDVVVVEITLAASPTDVYHYWTDPGRYKPWIGRTVLLDPRPGGEFFIRMTDGFAAMGTFVNVASPDRIEFTWGWAPGAGESVLAGTQPDDLLPPGNSA
jgi:uncharacterized protein YndB with AHSA1/START domain